MPFGSHGPCARARSRRAGRCRWRGAQRCRRGGGRPGRPPGTGGPAAGRWSRRMSPQAAPAARACAPGPPRRRPRCAWRRWPGRSRRRRGRRAAAHGAAMGWPARGWVAAAGRRRGPAPSARLWPACGQSCSRGAAGRRRRRPPASRCRPAPSPARTRRSAPAAAGAPPRGGPRTRPGQRQQLLEVGLRQEGVDLLLSHVLGPCHRRRRDPGREAPSRTQLAGARGGERRSAPGAAKGRHVDQLQEYQYLDKDFRPKSGRRSGQGGL